ncbi:MAG: MBL fold metallo-hydrolase [Hyphomicrobium sp.]|nr:MAG: MBL fold metallo-hydrolase [Hyphomicrobium sp.]
MNAKQPKSKPARAHRPPGGGRDELVFVALGGLGEIGMNVYLYGFGPEDARQWLMVDLGLTFPGDAEPGADVVLPDLRFIAEQRQALVGIVLTHAHEDHIGAVVDLWPELKAPIYATPFTAGMLRSKSTEFGGKGQLPITEVPLGGRFKLGPFDLEFVTMAHSIPEPSALAIRTSLGLVLHTGDWKLDATPLVGDPPDEKRLKELGEEGVLALVCDSTNAFRDGSSPSEMAIAKSLTDIIKGAKRRVAVTTFASNVARVQAVADAARASNRELVIAGRALHRVIEVGRETGYLAQGFRYHDQQRFSDFDAVDTLLLCTGSQGEPRAALARISEEDHPEISLDKGDLVVFSSRTIPGNEKSVSRVQNNLARIGCDVLTDSEALVHVTGHPRREELRQMYAWIRPQITVPMHGEARHLKEQARLAREAGVKDVFPILNGEILRLAPEPKVIDDAPVGRRYRDGKLIVPDMEGPVRERRKLSSVGVIVVSLVLNKRGDLVGEPEIDIDGVPTLTAKGSPMSDIVFDAIDGTMRSIPPARRRDPALVEDAVRRAVRGGVNEAWGKKPICKVLVHVLDGRA